VRAPIAPTPARAGATRGEPVAIVRPFRAVRPTPAAAVHVASPPYDVLSVDEARALAAAEPASFLRVTRPEIELPSGTDPHADVVYARGRDAFQRLLAAGTLERDPEPALYAYRLRAGGHEQLGVAGTFAVDEYRRGIVKPHERTRRDKEDDRTRHIEVLGAQTGPVLLAYRAAPAVDAVLVRVAAAPPLFDFTAADDVGHTVWRIAAADTAALVAAFAREVAALYIADGHHRAAAAARAAAAHHPAATPGARDADDCYFLAVAFPHDRLRILPYHRTVRDLVGRTPADFLAALAARGAVRDLRPGVPPPAGRGRVAMYTGGRWYEFALAAAHPDDPVRGLDTDVLQAEVLGPLLGIVDPRSDARIDFVGGVQGPEELQRRVDSGRAAVAFALHPLSIEALLRVADAGAYLPPKSTWFEPKLRDGLLVHAFQS
jgi:uncharacterized protein (DUF1015 family)